jgi:hypothetical protein
MKAGGKVDWAIALIVVGGVFLWTRSKKAPHTKIEIITEKNRLYLVEPEDVAALQAKLKAAGESIRSINPR